MRHYGREYLGHWVLALVLEGVALLPLDYGSRQRSLPHVLLCVLSHADGAAPATLFWAVAFNISTSPRLWLLVPAS